MTDCKHQWYVVDDSSADDIWWTCSNKCGSQKVTSTAGRHLNNAIAAVYANVGPSVILVDIRKAMEILDIPEISEEWIHWSSASDAEWGYTSEAP